LYRQTRSPRSCATADPAKARRTMKALRIMKTKYLFINVSFQTEKIFVCFICRLDDHSGASHRPFSKRVCSPKNTTRSAMHGQHFSARNGSCCGRRQQQNTGPHCGETSVWTPAFGRLVPGQTGQGAEDRRPDWWPDKRRPCPENQGGSDPV